MNFIDQITEDIKAAMKARDHVKLEALRGIKKELIEAKTAKGAYVYNIVRTDKDNELSDSKPLGKSKSNSPSQPQSIYKAPINDKNKKRKLIS